MNKTNEDLLHRNYLCCLYKNKKLRTLPVNSCASSPTPVPMARSFPSPMTLLCCVVFYWSELCLFHQCHSSLIQKEVIYVRGVAHPAPMTRSRQQVIRSMLIMCRCKHIYTFLQYKKFATNLYDIDFLYKRAVNTVHDNFIFYFNFYVVQN